MAGRTDLCKGGSNLVVGGIDQWPAISGYGFSHTRRLWSQMSVSILFAVFKTLQKRVTYARASPNRQLAPLAISMPMKVETSFSSSSSFNMNLSCPGHIILQSCGSARIRRGLVTSTPNSAAFPAIAFLMTVIDRSFHGSCDSYIQFYLHKISPEIDRSRGMQIKRSNGSYHVLFDLAYTHVLSGEQDFMRKS